MYDITGEDIRVQELRRCYPRRGWFRLGRGGSAKVREHLQWLRELGFEPVGTGRPPQNAEMIYGPTGTVNRGGPGRRMRHYVGRWMRPKTKGE